MKKIIISAATLQKGGAERVISLLSKEFLQYFDSVEIVLWLKSDICYPIDARVKVINIEQECKSSNLLKKAWWFRRYVIKTKPSRVLSFLAIFNLLVLTSLLFASTPVYVADRSNPNKDLKNKTFNFLRVVLYKICAKRILIQSNYNKEMYPRILQSKIDVIPNPISLTTKEIGLALRTEKKAKIVTVGRLEYAKNQEMLIRAFSKIDPKFESYKLYIYGCGSLENRLKEIITELFLSDRVILAGVVDSVGEKICDASLFAFTSRWEGMPNAVIEAMGLGLPVITTNIAGIGEFVKDGENGFTIESEDEDALIQCLNYTLHNLPIAQKMGEKAVDITKELDMKIIFPKWIEVLS